MPLNFEIQWFFVVYNWRQVCWLVLNQSESSTFLRTNQIAAFKFEIFNGFAVAHKRVGLLTICCHGYTEDKGMHVGGLWTTQIKTFFFFLLSTNQIPGFKFSNSSVGVFHIRGQVCWPSVAMDTLRTKQALRMLINQSHLSIFLLTNQSAAFEFEIQWFWWYTLEGRCSDHLLPWIHW